MKRNSEQSAKTVFCNKVRYRYVPVQETLTSDELGTYVTYGISVRAVEEEIAFISDVSADFEEIRHLADVCTENQLSPEHLSEVIYDFISEGTLNPV